MPENLLSTAGLSFERLRAFLEIGDARGISRAAKGNPNRQSQLSRQLSELEAFFGAPLVNRGRRVPFSLTDTGCRLKAVVAQHFSALNELKHATKDAPVTVRIGAGESLLTWLVVPALASRPRSERDVRFVLLNRRSSEVIAAVAEGSLELGIVRRDTPADGLKCASLGRVESVLVTPVALTKRNTEGLPLAIMDKTGSREVDGKHPPKQMRGRADFSCTSYVQMRELVLRGCCAAVLPRFLAADLQPPRFELKPMRGFKSGTGLMVVCNESFLELRPSTAAVVRGFAEVLRRTIRGF